MKKFIFEDEAEDTDILAEDDLDLVEDDEEVEQVNEVRYIDPANLDKYDKDEIEEVTTSSGEKRYRRKQAGGQSAQMNDKGIEQKEKDFASQKVEYIYNDFSDKAKQLSQQITSKFKDAYDKTYNGSFSAKTARKPNIEIDETGKVHFVLGHNYSKSDGNKAAAFAKRLGLDPNDFTQVSICGDYGPKSASTLSFDKQNGSLTTID